MPVQHVASSEALSRARATSHTSEAAAGMRPAKRHVLPVSPTGSDQVQGRDAASQGLSSGTAAEVNVELERRYGRILQGPRPLDLPPLTSPTAAGDAAGAALLSECTSVLRAKHVEFLHSAHQLLLHVSFPARSNIVALSPNVIALARPTAFSQSDAKLPPAI